MTRKQTISGLKKFQGASTKSKVRRGYLGMFEKRMAYRTTKTENPEVTMKMVEKALKSRKVR